jgi:hypothetical protein
MMKRDLQNEKLDRIRRRLIASASVPDSELEKILQSPQLFDRVKTRIKAEHRREDRQTKSFFGAGRGLSALNRQKTFAAAAFLMFITFGALGFIVLKNPDSSPQSVAERISLPQTQFPADDRKSEPSDIFEAPPEIVKTKNFARQSRPNIRKAVLKNEAAASPKRLRQRKNSVKRHAEIEPEAEFYALNYHGAALENGEDLRIIRTELSRSSLFALGVNVTIENESEKIKTDLLVGADGVAKAIRLVK